MLKVIMIRDYNTIAHDNLKYQDYFMCHSPSPLRVQCIYEQTFTVRVRRATRSRTAARPQ